MAIELQEERRRFLPLIATLEHLGGLLEKPRPLEGLPRETAVLRELRVIGGRACHCQAPEPFFEIAAVVLSGPPIVTRLGTDFGRLQIVPDPLEDRGSLGESACLDEQTRRFVILALALIDLGGISKTTVVLENLGRTLPIARSVLRVPFRLRDSRFLLADPEDLLPSRATLRRSDQNERHHEPEQLGDFNRQMDLAQDVPGQARSRGDGGQTWLGRCTTIIQTALRKKRPVPFQRRFGCTSSLGYSIYASVDEGRNGTRLTAKPTTTDTPAPTRL